MDGTRVRAARGAVPVERDDPEEILGATRSLLEEMVRGNSISPADIVSIFFTATPDLRSAFPAEAARRMGMRTAPLLCASEIAVQGAMRGVVRILLHFHTDRSPEDVVHVYVGRTRELRDDLD